MQAGSVLRLLQGRLFNVAHCLLGEENDGLLPFGTSMDVAATVQQQREKVVATCTDEGDDTGFAVLRSKRVPKRLPATALPKVMQTSYV
jgi:hypothetical protein